MRIGELFAGYGGLGMGAQAVLDGEAAWYSEIDKGALKILRHRFPDVPNVGDITAVDWSQVEPVDVLTGGFPCQDVSSAGKRAGMRPDTRSGLWTHMAYAIDELRPPLVVIENVRGLLSADAHSDVEPCPWCMGDDTDGALRALGAVLGDLADLGYDAAWHGLRAADVGAPHGRFRVFVVAWPADSAGDAWRVVNGDRGAAGHAESVRRQRWQAQLAGPLNQPAGDDSGALLPTPRVSMGNGPSQAELDAGDPKRRLETAAALLPTPRATDGTKGGLNQRGSSGDLMLPSAVQLLPTPLAIEAGRLLPTPKATNNENRPSPGFDNNGEMFYHIMREDRWGQYAAAVARWEALTRPAPPPTEMGPKGSPRLSPRFVEWMMNLPEGWVTDVPGITRNEALKALGNGVVPAQAAVALRILLPHVGAMVA